MARPPVFDTEINRAPALRISNVVRGRANEDGRVRYLVDPDGKGDERAIPEDVVLKRWRRRVMTGHTFHGCRLGPNLWRAIANAFGTDAQAISRMNTKQIDDGRENLHRDRNKHFLWLPDTSTVMEIFGFLGPVRLQTVLDRHLHPDRNSNYGTPDLFLYARKSGTNEPAFFRLVEVKKPKERISKDQHEEIEFLRSIGVPARVLRLIERQD